MQILVVSNTHTAASPQDVARICAVLRDRGAAVTETAFAGIPGQPPAIAIPAGTDTVIAIGGDGTIMHVAKCAAAAGLPVLGINGGKLGFLAGMEVNETAGLEALLDGNVTVEERLLLDVTLQESGETHLAMNEAVVSRGALSRLVDLTVHADEDTMCYRADGVLIATPTGSTAYSLSAGGPVVDPRVPCMLLTPVCPHSLYARSYVFAADTLLAVEATSADTFLTVDGETEIPLSPGETVTVRRSVLKARLIRLKKQSFYNTLERKLINRGR